MTAKYVALVPGQPSTLFDAPTCEEPQAPAHGSDTWRSSPIKGSTSRE